jgi:hypothetical protein
MQNAAMRIITGSHKMASPEYLQAEAGMLSISRQLNLACSQYLINASTNLHPSHDTVRLPTGTRPSRKDVVHTLQSRFGHTVEPFLNDDGVVPEISRKRALKSLHTKAVVETKAKLISKLLGTVAPDIDPSESTLLRRTRTTFSQVRSIYCNKLKSYQARIGPDPDDLCPACTNATHTSEHLFNCISFPTNLTKRDLWSHPQEAADFLRSMPSFGHLPINLPLPPPSPEPPPAVQD